MPTTQRKQVRKRPGRPKHLGPASRTPLSSPPSLPPVVAGSAPTPPLVPRLCTACGWRITHDRRVCPYCHVKQPIEPKEPKPAWALAPDSKIRTSAMQIIAMRISGMGDEEIAAALNLSQRSLSSYLYKAGKNGWLNIDNPKDRLEYQVLHKVVRNIDDMLDSPDPEVKQQVTMETAKGTIFKSFGEQMQQLAPSTLVAIKIEMPPGPPQVIRAETTGGLPAYVDAQK